MKVCVVTTGQPSSNPRLVKEADALAERGHDVQVIGAHWAEWASSFDAGLIGTRRWGYRQIDWRRQTAPEVFWRSRLRHWAARRAMAFAPLQPAVAVAASNRIAPELRREATSVPADLYIAHNLGALPAAHAAAKKYRARVGFDAEDFHSGQLSAPEHARAASTARHLERRLIPGCDFVTAASPGIAEAYRDLCGIPLPVCVLNVFPLRDRPRGFRPSAATGPVRMYWFSQTIGPDRGLEQVVRAMGLLGTTSVELHLRGTWQDGYEGAIRALAAKVGVPSDLITSHAPDAPDRMVAAAAAYDVGLAVEPPVSVNNDILLSNKVFTYLLAGNALIATRTRAHVRLAPQLGAAAALCQPGDAADLAASLDRWIRNRNALEDARRHAWSLGETRFNWEQEKSAFLAVAESPADAAPRVSHALSAS